MLKSQEAFNLSIADAKNGSVLYEYLTENVVVPMSFDDILRAQIVYAVSAFDKLMHDLIRIGMVRQFAGLRAVTPKFSADPMPMSVHQDIVSAEFPVTPESIYEKSVFQKLSFLSFQDPKKVADGLSYIWDEKGKWTKISAEIGLPEDQITTQLKLFATRRNAIVHEADMNPMSHVKNAIAKIDADSCVDFMGKC
jgi:hypothetical protein